MSGAASRSARSATPDRAQLRAWLEYVAQTAIEWLDQLDAETDELEDDEREDDREAVRAA